MFKKPKMGNSSKNNQTSKNTKSKPSMGSPRTKTEPANEWGIDESDFVGVGNNTDTRNSSSPQRKEPPVRRASDKVDRRTDASKSREFAEEKLAAQKSMAKLRQNISGKINEAQGGAVNTSTFKAIAESAVNMNDTGEEDEYARKIDFKIRAKKGDPSAREYLLDAIERELLALRVSEANIDKILTHYAVNYFAGYTSIYKGVNQLFIKKLARLFIRKDADYDIKITKLAQIMYQDLYGVGVVDELLHLGIDKTDMSKIEEVACYSGGNTWIQISGIKERIHGLDMGPLEVESVVKRLSTASDTENLNAQNQVLLTDTIRGDRLTLRCPPYSSGYGFNIRLHYDNVIDSKTRIRLGSTSLEVESFLDDIVSFKPNIMVVGGQGSGKTTFIRDIYRRYPANTTIGTVESSLELNLGMFDHLNVEQLKTVKNRNYEQALEDMLRMGLDMMVIGETRSPEEVVTMIQIMLRQGNGSSTSFHESSARGTLYSLRTLAMRSGHYTSEAQAMFEICRSLDLIIVLACDNVGENATGRRYIKEICEVPMVTEDSKDINPSVLFSVDPATMKIVKGEPMSEVLQAKFLDKYYNPALLKKVMACK